MRTTVLATALACVASASCTDDLNAPANYLGNEDTTIAGNDTVLVGCETPARAAVAAYYENSIDVEGGTAPYRFATSDALPRGVTLDDVTGVIAGTPTDEGTYDFTVKVTDANEATGTASCQLVVAPQFSIDPLTDVDPRCITGQDSLLNHVVTGTGDETPITCDKASGSGNGVMPSGITIDPDTCAIEGAVDDPRLGTWAFIVRASQSGVEQFVPYCVSNTQAEPGSYALEVTHSGIPDATLAPLTSTFGPDGLASVGSSGDPLFTISSPEVCSSNTCYYGYGYVLHSSLFASDTFSLDPTAVYRDDMGNAVGFTHGFHIEATSIPDAFLDRPWAFNLELDYCLATTPEACSSAMLPDHVGARLELSVLMFPE